MKRNLNKIEKQWNLIHETAKQLLENWLRENLNKYIFIRGENF